MAYCPQEELPPQIRIGELAWTGDGLAGRGQGRGRPRSAVVAWKAVTRLLGRVTASCRVKPAGSYNEVRVSWGHLWKGFRLHEAAFRPGETYLAQRSCRDSNKLLVRLALALFKAETEHLHSLISLPLQKIFHGIVTNLVTDDQILNAGPNAFNRSSNTVA
jgi:hypothetical protein